MTVAGVTTRFATFPSDLQPDALEQEMMRLWESEQLFEQVESETRGRREFVFFEGPPTANGRPGIHHVFARTVKDLFCRYRVMSGYHVTRKAGWDTHGLPVEIEVEKQLGISGKQQIEEVGVEKFNQQCRESVWRYRDDWERLSRRIAFWLDYDNAYVTYSNDYIESVWWALATLHSKDLLFRGHKILPYCARCGTALSSHEVAQGYEEVEDPSVYVALDLDLSSNDRDVSRSPSEGARILVWTTTPWTLVSNTALAVHPELRYAELRRQGRDDGTLILAEARIPGVLGEDWRSRWDTVRTLLGEDLVGLRYRRPLDWVSYGEGEHEIIVGESFVSSDDGSGVVHMSPAFGADDYAAGKRHGLAFVQPVNGRGEFPDDMPVVGGQHVKRADPLIIEELKRRGVLFRAGTLTHSYPHCWRCRQPLLYFARESWFVRTTGYRDEMLLRNADVSWQPPEVGRGRFGEWLENNIDWALSRDRYWGTPLPLWVCDSDATHVEAIGSYERLAQRWGKPLPENFDPHKPYIDAYTWPCDRCSGTMQRVPQVIDTWFDSGSMPFAQWHYPFENHDLTERHYPADFIAEGVDQTRGWFYSLLAIAAGLGDDLPNNSSPAPYKSVVVNDIVLDAQGMKMSKSRGNIVDPWTVLPKHGADSVRLFFVASSQVWTPRRFDEDGIRELSGRFLLTLRNIYSGIFAQYANFGWEPGPDDPSVAERPLLDRWILSRLEATRSSVSASLEAYDATAAARELMRFVTDDVSNWYVRLTRGRFYEVDSSDNRAAFATLHTVLVTVNRLLAPFCPFTTDWMHRQLTGRTVHMGPFGTDSPLERDPGLETAMEQVRTLARLGRAAREEAGVRVRQPLSRLVCVVPNLEDVRFRELLGLLEQELNVRQVEVVSSGDSLVRLEARPNFRALGKRFGKSTPLAAAALGGLDSETLTRLERGAEVAITVEGEPHLVQLDDVTIVRRASGDLVVSEEAGFFAAIDPAITPALRAEGLARELVSQVQRMRREAEFAVSDRIVLHVSGNEEAERVVSEYSDYVSAEVLARKITTGGDQPGTPHAVRDVELAESVMVRVALTRV